MSDRPYRIIDVTPPTPEQAAWRRAAHAGHDEMVAAFEEKARLYTVPLRTMRSEFVIRDVPVWYIDHILRPAERVEVATFERRYYMARRPSLYA